MRKKYTMGKIVFFGAGKQGKYWIKCARGFGIKPDRVIDNNKDLWGSIYETFKIDGPNCLQSFSFDQVFITCNREQEICAQLLKLGISENKIIYGSYNILNHLIYNSTENMRIKENEGNPEIQSDKKRVLYDMQNGLVLGGIESWIYELAARLKEIGYAGIYLTTDIADLNVMNDTYPVHVFACKEIGGEKNRIEICVREIIENLPCTIICNFTYYNFWSACIVKHLYPDQIRIIAVQHNDESAYYETYGLWQECIDKCLAISSLMKHKLVTMGMKQEKIGFLRWQIPCEAILQKVENKTETCLHIGYAGRVTVLQKRIDLTLLLAKKLKQRHLLFQITIAGTGDYSDTLYQQIQQENLQDYIVPIGYIDRKDIPDFWSKQDIMISCSEWEGHSISQSEAMAAGAVPVITDVSGAKDDVTDGYNGYIVDVGDLDTMADRIEYLYHNRDKLYQMGQRAHDTIYERQKNFDQAQFWDDLIKEVWQK